MARVSAGVLVYRRRSHGIEVLLAHPGGPFWAHKDAGAWGIPKGERQADEELEATARREFAEETGFVLTGLLQPIGSVRQASGKMVSAWAVEAEYDAAAVRSNFCAMEWPPRSGRTVEFPEVDRAAWFTLPAAREAMLKSQCPLLDKLEEWLRASAQGDQK
jgi:predicted NUDIX family NTP pyrophosphohydrolase